MDFLELAQKRYSVREFSGRQIEKEKVDRVLEAGRSAPTAANFQPQRILVLDSPENLQKLRDCTPYHFDAPMALLVCYDSAASRKRMYDGKDHGEIDASIATTHMMLEIADLGLGSTWVGHFDPQAVREAYGLPESYVPVALLPLGYPAENSAPHPNHSKRIPKNEMVFYNTFGE